MKCPPSRSVIASVSSLRLGSLDRETNEPSQGDDKRYRDFDCSRMFVPCVLDENRMVLNDDGRDPIFLD